MRASSSTSNSKGLKPIWIRIIVFNIILLIMLTLIGNKFESISTKNQASTYAKQALNTFYSDEKEVDMIFLGSSHSYCTFDPEYFDKNLGIYSYQLGTPLQHPDTSYYMLQEVIKGKNPKNPTKVVLEIYWDMLDDRFELKQADMFLEAIQNENLEKEYIKNVFPLNEKIKYNFKPIRYQQDAFAYYNKNLTDFVNEHKVDRNPKQQNYTEYYKDRGFLYTDKEMPDEELYATNQFRNMDANEWEFDKVQKQYIKDLARFCVDNSINLYLVTAPIANKSIEYIKDYDVIHNKISDFVEDELENMPYIDYNIVNREENLLTNKDFCDDAHLNNKGAVIVQEHFINWLKGLEGSNLQ